MTEPVRIQRRRVKGWNMQDASPNGLPVVYVGRPSKWGNPFRLTSRHPIKVAASVDYYRRWLGDEYGLGVDPEVDHYRRWLDGEAGLGPDSETGIALAILARLELRGKNVACWCPPGPCHADVLLEIANR